MPTSTGSASKLFYLKETTLGTFPSGNFNQLAFSSESISANIGVIKSQQMSADRSAPSARGGNIQVGGSITTDFGLSRFGIFLAHLLGAAPTTTTITPTAGADSTAYVRGEIVSVGSNDYICVTGGTSSSDIEADVTGTEYNVRLTSGTAQFVYMGATATAKKSHVFTGDSDLLAHGLSVERAFLGGTSDVYLRCSGGRINSLAITIPQEGIIQSVWDMLFLGQLVNAGSSGAGTPVASDEPGPIGYNTFIEIEGVESGIIQDGNFTISNELDGDSFVVGSRYRRSISAQRRNITGSFNMLFEDDTHLEQFLNESELTLSIWMQEGGAIAKFDFPRVRLSGDGAPKITGAGRITQSFNFDAMGASGSYDVRVTLKNTTASYTP